MVTEILTLPESWRITTVGDVAEVKGGKRLPKGDKFADGLTPFPYIRVTDFANFGVDTSDLRYLRPETQASIKRYTISTRDVYISIAGSIGFTGIIPSELEGANLTENAAKLVITKPEVDARFLMYFLGSEIAQKEIRSQTVKNAQPKLALARISSLKIPLPPTKEQRKIAGVLGVVRRAIEQQERLLALTAELKKALLHKLFTEGLHGEPQKQTEIGPVPGSWEVRRLGDYARVMNGFAFRSHDYVEGGVRIIRISNVGIGTLIEKDDKYLPHRFLHEKAEYALEEGDLVLSLTRPIIAEGFKFCFIQKTDLPALLNQRVGKFQITNSKLLKQYLSHVVFSDYFTKPLRIMAEGSNQPNISPTRLENFLIPVPTNMTEQGEIAQILTNITKKREFAQRKVLALTDLFRTLLHQLMTAQIRVYDLELPELEAIP